MAARTPGEIEEQYNQASRYGLPPATWIPPDWETAKPKLVDTVKQNVVLNGKFKSLASTEDFPGQENPTKQDNESHGYLKWPHPDSDFEHEHHDAFTVADLQYAKTKLDTARYEKLTKVVGDGTLGMQRLACIFDWILHNVHELLKQMDLGLGNAEDKDGNPLPENQAAYLVARHAYIRLLQDLDDHKPHGRQIVPGQPGFSGYGKALKWVSVFPLIRLGKIIGAKVVVEWNPHSSSNGIPIKHN